MKRNDASFPSCCFGMLCGISFSLFHPPVFILLPFSVVASTKTANNPCCIAYRAFTRKTPYGKFLRSEKWNGMDGVNCCYLLPPIIVFNVLVFVVSSPFSFFFKTSIIILPREQSSVRVLKNFSFAAN